VTYQSTEREMEIMGQLIRVSDYRCSDCGRFDMIVEEKGVDGEMVKTCKCGSESLQPLF